MKNRYLHALSAGLILERDYDPVRTETGAYVFGNELKVLSRFSKGVNFIIELLDGDNLSAEEIQERVKADQEILEADISGEITHLIGVYVFESQPPPEKLTKITNTDRPRGQEIPLPGGTSNRGLNGTGRRKYRSYYSVNLENRTITGHFQSNAPADGLEKLLRRAFSAPDSLDAPPDIHQLLIQRDREYRIAFKTRKTTVTYTLIAINIAVWLILTLLAFYFRIPYDNLLILGAKINQYAAHGEYWRLFTPIFLHGNEIHLLVNCYSLYILGQLAERIYGPRKFAIIYFGAGLLGNIMSMIFTSPYAYGVGASGAIFGLLGAVLYFGIENPKVFKKYFGANVIATVIINLVIASLIPNIDSFAHLGGLIGGFLVSGIVKVNAPSSQFPSRRLMLTITLFLAIAGLFYGIRVNS
ncbi:MAG: rhomboid family intramembrane serine protease [Firmicutes bacterium]|nr:rhomboid family intramembrane serine protease [Bacillota bacterium]